MSNSQFLDLRWDLGDNSHQWNVPWQLRIKNFIGLLSGNIKLYRFLS